MDSCQLILTESKMKIAHLIDILPCLKAEEFY